MSDSVGGGHGARSSEARGLRFEMLGPLRVVRDGCAVDLGGPQQRAVLAELLLESDPPVSVGRLATALWGDRPPPGGTATIQTYVFHLREALEPDRAHGARARVLVTQRGGYRLETDGVVVDASEFEILARAGIDGVRTAPTTRRSASSSPRSACGAGTCWPTWRSWRRWLRLRR